MRVVSMEDKNSSKAPLLRVRGLYKSFWLEEKRVEVLRDLQLEVFRGESVAILGQSGAGKSTLLHLLGTLDRPNSGSIEILGQDVLSLGDDQLAEFRNRNIGFIFQLHYLLPEFSALENTILPALIARRDREEAVSRARQLLQWVGLGERMEHRPGELSGGERQRVALCRALILKPPLLLADEPTGNLDARTADGIHSLILQLTDSWGVTPIVVTHNIQLARRMETCYLLEGGKLRPVSSEEFQALEENLFKKKSG